MKFATFTAVASVLTALFRNTRYRRGRSLVFMVVLIAFAAFTPIHAQDPQKDRASPEPQSRGDLRTFVPTTVSAGWRDVYEKLPDPTQEPTMPGPDDIEAWGKIHRAKEEAAEADVQQVIQRYTIRVLRRDFGGVPVLEITPKAVSYTHLTLPTICFKCSSRGGRGE